jgi:hypothetical protein
MVYNTQSFWVSGLCPLSKILILISDDGQSPETQKDLELCGTAALQQNTILPPNNGRDSLGTPITSSSL